MVQQHSSGEYNPQGACMQGNNCFKNVSNGGQRPITPALRTRRSVKLVLRKIYCIIAKTKVQIKVITKGRSVDGNLHVLR